MARSLVTIPLVKIDDAMAAEAVRTGARVGVLATLPTTLAPTVRLVRAQAEKPGGPLGVEGLAKGAFEALVAGQAEDARRTDRIAAERVAVRPTSSSSHRFHGADGGGARQANGQTGPGEPAAGRAGGQETLERMRGDGDGQDVRTIGRGGAANPSRCRDDGAPAGDGHPGPAAVDRGPRAALYFRSCG